MPSRRSHQNSHHGCKQCKLRRVKCDEGKPYCKRCLRKNQRCLYNHLLSSSDEVLRYGTPKNESARTLMREATSQESLVPIVAQARLEFPLTAVDKNTQDLFYHYVNVICKTRPFASPDQSFAIWDSSIRRHFTHYEFLYHGICTFSALHLATLACPSNANEYLDLAYKHQNTALASFQLVLGHITSDNCEASLAFSGLTALSALAFMLAAHSLHESFTFDPVKELKQIISLFGGTAALYNISRDMSWNSHLVPSIRNSVVLDIPEEPCLGPEASLDLLKEEASRCLFGHNAKLKLAYVFVIEKLKKAFRCTAAYPGIANFALMWLAMVAATHHGRTYMALLECHDPIALAILAHWAVCICSIEDLWFTRKWAEFAIKVIAMLLNKQSHRLIRWPIQQLWGDDATSLDRATNIGPPDTSI